MSLLDTNCENLVTSSGYAFSATPMDKLGSTSYTLVSLVLDVSGSVAPFASQLETMVQTVLKSCRKSPHCDSLMFRLTTFNSHVAEFHGFKLLGEIDEASYKGALNCGGMTALFEAVDESIQATTTLGGQLTSKDFLANGIIVIVTDGQNNSGRVPSAVAIKKSLEAARRSENLESIMLILVGVTSDDNALDSYLQSFKDDAGITQYVSIGQATPGKLAKLAALISQSVSSTSQALGSGGPSQPIKAANLTF